MDEMECIRVKVRARARVMDEYRLLPLSNIFCFNSIQFYLQEE